MRAGGAISIMGAVLMGAVVRDSIRTELRGVLTFEADFRQAWHANVSVYWFMAL